MRRRPSALSRNIARRNRRARWEAIQAWALVACAAVVGLPLVGLIGLAIGHSLTLAP